MPIVILHGDGLPFAAKVFLAVCLLAYAAFMFAGAITIFRRK